MKTAEPKTTSVAKNTRAKQPFFSRKGADGFFGRSEPEHMPFFKLSPAYSVNGSSILQTKLTVGQPDDKYEREADKMADKVVRATAMEKVSLNKQNMVQTKPLYTTITSLIQTKCAECEQEEKLQKKDKEDRQSFSEEIQGKSFREKGTFPPDDNKSIQRKCAACEREEKLQKKALPSTKTAGTGGIEHALNASKGGGSLLPVPIRKQMEGSFGVDFSNVRLHTDNEAVKMNKNLQAMAFTHGKDIYFNSGKFNATSAEGKHLLAHELTHVVQQNKVDTVYRACDPTVSSCIPQSYNDCNPNYASCPQPLSGKQDNPLELIPGTAAGSFSLIPIGNPPGQLLSDVPEGAIVDYQATPLPAQLQGQLPDMQAKEFIGPGSSSLLSAINQSLMAQGFAAIPNGNGIGIIAIPRLGTAGAAIPESLSTWGHTAVYVRVNGQISIVRGFTVDSFFDAARNLKSVPAGEAAIPGAIANDRGLFTITNARTVEWPVTVDSAKALADSLPEAGTPPAGGSSMYTGRPGVFGPGASNCVGWACSAVEGPLAGKVGSPKLGSVAEPVNVAAGLQGRMMQLTKTTSSDISPAGAVTSGMPLRFQVLKWGGRVFLVVGAAITIKQIIEAEGSHKREIQGQAFGSFAGGVALGAFAAGFCVGAGIATGGIALLLCAGIAGAAGAYAGHKAGGAIGKEFD